MTYCYDDINFGRKRVHPIGEGLGVVDIHITGLRIQTFADHLSHDNDKCSRAQPGKNPEYRFQYLSMVGLQKVKVEIIPEV